MALTDKAIRAAKHSRKIVRLFDGLKAGGKVTAIKRAAA